MPVYYGSQKQKDLYYGGQKIKQAYYGSTLVYSNDGLPVWGFYGTYSHNPVFIRLFGEYSKSGIAIMSYRLNPSNGTPSEKLYYSETGVITKITGTLGNSNSKIIIKYEDGLMGGEGEIELSYRTAGDGTYTCSNKTFYQYQYTGASFFGIIAQVYSDSRVGDTVLLANSMKMNPKELTSTTIKLDFGGGSTVTATKDSSYNKKWSKSGLVDA